MAHNWMITSDSIGDESRETAHVLVTVDEMLYEGLLLAGLSAETQQKQPKSNLSEFVDRYGSTPLVLATMWEDLQVSENEDVRVPDDKLKLMYYLMVHHFLRHYRTESERKATSM